MRLEPWQTPLQIRHEARGIMRGENLLELRPRDMLARRRRCGEGGIFVDTAARVNQVRIARRQPFILIAAPRALQFLSDQRA